jgi:hypothetical protein
VHTPACSVALLALLIFGGCEEPPRQHVDTATQPALVIAVTPAAPRVGDRVAVHLQVNTPDDYDVQFPDTGAFGELNVRPAKSCDRRPGPIGTVWTQDFEFEPLVSGTIRVPVLAVTCHPSAATPAEPIEIRSDEFTFEVASALTAADDPLHPRPVTAPLLPPAPPWTWWQWALLSAAPLAALALFLGIRRRLRQPPPHVPPLAPEEWARRSLATLDPDDWLPRGAERDYYYRLTEIVRGYIERRFGLAAPEMTTPEFLARLASEPQALAGEGERLRAFLVACDLVKYAAAHPGIDSARAAHASAFAFVVATAEAAIHDVGGQAA